MEIQSLTSNSDAKEYEHGRLTRNMKLGMALAAAAAILQIFFAVLLYENYIMSHKALEALQKGNSSMSTTQNSVANAPVSVSPVSDLSHVHTKYPILPKRIYSVIGLESSGTQFLTGVIRDALNQTQYREGSNPCKPPCKENDEVSVQHFSLPWGSTCQHHSNPPVVDVVLPSQCTRMQSNDDEDEQCRKMVQDLWGVDKSRRKQIKYPPRYQLNIVKHKEWYDAQGVEQFFIILVRDQKISFTARQQHCNITRLREEEEAVGTQIIVDAINKYVLNKEGYEKVTAENYKFWAAQEFNHGQMREGGRRLASLPFGNNVVVVSYESMMKLGSTYIEMLYKSLGIESTKFPLMLNGNDKYIATSKPK